MRFVDTVRNMVRPMVAPLVGHPGIVLTRSTTADNLHDGSLQARTLTALNKILAFDILFPMMDLTVEAEALGARVDWEIDELPAVVGRTVETMEDAEALVVPEIGDGNRLNVFVDSCRDIKRKFPEKLVWAYVLGPFSIAGRLMEMTEIAIAVKLEPELVHCVLRKCNDLLLKYAKALLDTDVDGLMVLEPASSLLRADDADEFSNAYIRELVELITREGKTPALHNCGSIGHLVESLCATGIEALSVGSVVDPFEVYQRMPETVALLGNLDPTEVFLRGTPESIRNAAVHLADRMADCPRFILSSGCDLPPRVSIENMKAFEEAAIADDVAVA